MAVRPILIAQISDLHVKPLGELAYGHVDTASAVVRCIAKLNVLADYQCVSDLFRRFPARPTEKAENEKWWTIINAAGIKAE